MTDLQTLPVHLQLLVREYGLSTYQLIRGLREVEDVAERTRRAGQIVQLILRLQPTLRENPDVQTILWSHVHALAGEDVALEAPVPLKSLAQRPERPAPIPYPARGPRLRAYGAAIEALIAKALTLEDGEEREQATVQIGRTMKFLYRQHNKENAKDVTILRHLGELSGGQLRLDPALVDSQRLFEMNVGSGGRTPDFIVLQPSQRESREGRDKRDRDRGPGNKSGKKRKKNRQEPQQPPQ